MFLVFFPHLLKFSLVFLRDLSWDPCSSICLLMIYVMQFPTLSIYAEDIKIYRAVKPPQDCNLLQSDINSIQRCCIANCMKLSISKTKVISFCRKTNILNYDSELCQSSITQTDSRRDLRVFTNAELHFHDHVNYIFSRCIKLLGLVRSITFNFSSLECMLRLYIKLVRSKLEYASVVWNSIMSTDANKLECIQQRFAALCLIVSFLKSITVILLLWSS
jgi:hypothetical protein